MLPRRLRYCRFHIRCRGGSWLALLGQVIAIVGLPLPPVSAKDRSQPFPCQHRACGCLSAADCWKSCCCFTAAQRLAWAREHEVETPDALVEEAEHEEVEHEAGGRDTDSKPCCTKKTKASTPKPKIASPSQGSRWVLVIQARRCHGASSDESQSSPTLIPTAPQRWVYEWTVVGSFPLTSVSAGAIAHLPPAPPPRVS